MPVCFGQGFQEFCTHAYMLARVCTGELGSACWRCEGILQQMLLKQLLFQWLVARCGKLGVHADTNQACPNTQMSFRVTATLKGLVSLAQELSYCVALATCLCKDSGARSACCS